jgi:hypothetical protein
MIWTHKKFQAGFIVAITILLGQLLPAYAETGDIVLALAKVNWFEVSAPVMAAIGAQGLADLGKEKAKVEADVADVTEAEIEVANERTWTE